MSPKGGKSPVPMLSQFHSPIAGGGSSFFPAPAKSPIPTTSAVVSGAVPSGQAVSGVMSTTTAESTLGVSSVGANTVGSAVNSSRDNTHSTNAIGSSRSSDHPHPPAPSHYPPPHHRNNNNNFLNNDHSKFPYGGSPGQSLGRKSHGSPATGNGSPLLSYGVSKHIQPGFIGQPPQQHQLSQPPQLQQQAFNAGLSSVGVGVYGQMGGMLPGQPQQSGLLAHLQPQQQMMQQGSPQQQPPPQQQQQQFFMQNQQPQMFMNQQSGQPMFFRQGQIDFALFVYC